MKHTWLIAFWLLSYFPAEVPTAVIDGDKFFRTLETLANEGLGVDTFQAHFDEVTFTDEPLNGADLRDKLSTSLQSKFNTAIQAVKALRTKIEGTLGKPAVPPNQPKKCCQADGLQESARFKTEINTREMCIMGSSQLTNPPVLSEDVLDTMKDNYFNFPSIKWQYFGQEEGLLTLYPTALQCDDSSDPRFRPWYAETATPFPKEVVVVIDKSGSVDKAYSKQLLDIAKEAAITAISTLNPADKVAVIMFADKAETYPGSRSSSTCYIDEFAQATPKNTRELIGYIQDVAEPVGTSNYTAAFEKAFSFFHHLPDASDVHSIAEHVILFITDGDTEGYDPDALLGMINNEQAKLTKDVTILTFGIGTGLSVDAVKLLQDIAGTGLNGKFTHIDHLGNLRVAMASYYNFFAQSSWEQPIFTAPHNDPFGLGLVTSVCLPVHTSAALKGVCCVDMTLNDLVEDVKYFKPGEQSYAFVVDTRGRVLMHPHLPVPLDDADALFVHLTSLERSSEIKTVMSSMTRGNTGIKSDIETHYLQPRGDIANEGLNDFKILATYYWKPVLGTNFSVCVVVATGDRAVSIDNIYKPHLPTSFTYHQFLKDPVCRFLNRVATKDRSATMFQDWAFQDPFTYIHSTETKIKFDGYEAYMIGDTNITADFKDGVRNMVAATAILDDIWTSSIEVSKYTVWRYFGSVNGVFRVLPGVLFDKRFDHTVRPWYKRSAGQKELITLSTPYIDALGAGVILALSQAVVRRSGLLHQQTKSLVGVMGMDFSMTYFYYLLAQDFPQCATKDNVCFIVDNSGFFVMHKDFVSPKDGETPDVADVHITQKEPKIAQDLISKGVLKKSACVNFATIRDLYFWKLIIPTLNRGKIVETKYELHEVPGSNVFLGIRPSETSAGERCTCQKEDGEAICTGKPCECPCKAPTDYDYCTDRFLHPADAWPTCLPVPPPVAFDPVTKEEEAKARQLPECFPYNCGNLTTELECVKVAGCSWCHLTRDDDSLTDPYCADNTACPFGIAASKKGTAGLNKWHIVGIVLGSVAALVIIIIIVILVVRYCRRKKPRPPAELPLPTDSHLYETPRYTGDDSPGPPARPLRPPPYTIDRLGYL